MRLMRKILDWIWRMAATKGALTILFLVAVSESIFFPLPPDLMLIPMCLARRDRCLLYAGVCLAGSVIGGVIGYIIGYYFMDFLGMPIVNFYGLNEQYIQIQQWYEAWNAWVVAAAGLTPIPYKLCTLTAGAFKVDFLVFLIASILSRGFRFFLVAGLLYVFGEKIRYFMEKRFDLVALITAAGVIAGFLLMKYAL